MSTVNLEVKTTDIPLGKMQFKTPEEAIADVTAKITEAWDKADPASSRRTIVLVVGGTILSSLISEHP